MPRRKDAKPQEESRTLVGSPCLSLPFASLRPCGLALNGAGYSAGRESGVPLRCHRSPKRARRLDNGRATEQGAVAYSDRLNLTTSPVMTKPKRVTLLLADILMILAGVAAMFFFVGLTEVVRIIHSEPEVTWEKTSPPHRLESAIVTAYQYLNHLTKIVDVCRWAFLVAGALLLGGGISHLCFTPWQLLADAKRPSSPVC